MVKARPTHVIVLAVNMLSLRKYHVKKGKVI